MTDWERANNFGLGGDVVMLEYVCDRKVRKFGWQSELYMVMLSGYDTVIKRNTFETLKLVSHETHILFVR